MLPTIRSRCQIISLNTKNSDLDIDMDRLSEVFSKVLSGDLSAYYKEKDYFLSFKDDKKTLLEGLIKILSDLISNKYLGESGLLSYDYNIETLTRLNLASVERLLDKFEKINMSFRNNINFELSVENIFLNIYREGRQG